MSTRAAVKSFKVTENSSLKKKKEKKAAPGARKQEEGKQSKIKRREEKEEAQLINKSFSALTISEGLCRNRARLLSGLSDVVPTLNAPLRSRGGKK